MPLQNAKDPGKIWLHTEIVDGRQKIVDQDGRVLGGVVSANIITGANTITTIDMVVEVAAKIDGDTIGIIV